MFNPTLPPPLPIPKSRQIYETIGNSQTQEIIAHRHRRFKETDTGDPHTDTEDIMTHRRSTQRHKISTHTETGDMKKQTGDPHHAQDI
jgi:hypothetical protein